LNPKRYAVAPIPASSPKALPPPVERTRHFVQIGRNFTPLEVVWVAIHVHPHTFSECAALAAPIRADPHYTAKA
jgi:hypothetical protein